MAISNGRNNSVRHGDSYDYTTILNSTKTQMRRHHEKNVNVEFALRLLDTCLVDARISVWGAVDRLDEAFQGFPQVEVPALRALLRTYLDVLDFPSIK